MIGPANEIEILIKEEGEPVVRLYLYASSRRDLLLQLRVELAFYMRVVVEYCWLTDSVLAALIEPESLANELLGVEKC